MAPNYNLLLPMKLDAFVFNEKVCDSEGPERAKIAPITQPNYTFLQIKEVQADILEHVDIHASAPANRNSRYTDIGKAIPRPNRLGVYIHWSLPRPLRSGVAATDKSDDKKERPENFDPSAPRYPAIPNRWLVIRHLDPARNPTVPFSNSHTGGIKEFKSWIIESDKTRNIDDIPITADLEVDVSPFITSYFKGSAADIKTEDQAEVFIGSCIEAANWDAEDKPKPGEHRVSLTAASSSNQLFIDYQYHCGNVFSMLDNFSYQDEHGQICYLEAAFAHYYVIGWHNDAEKDIMGTWSGEGATRADKLQKLRVDVEKAVPKDSETNIAEWLAGVGSARTLCHGAMYDVVWNKDELPTKIPADEVAKAMSTMPLSLGGSPMDAMLAYIGERDRSGVVEASMGALQTLHRAADDGVDAQIAATDEVDTSQYAHLDGGDHFFLPAQEGDKSGAPPSVDDQKAVRYLNCAQHLLDATNRRIKQLRWDMFSWWWKLVSDPDKRKDEQRAYEIQDEIETLEAMASELVIFIGQQMSSVTISAKKGVMEAFHQRNDPTLVVSNIEAGWPTDFNDALRARLDIQTVASNGPEPPSEAFVDKVHKDVRDTAQLLVKEFLWFKTPKPKTTYASGVVPLYHDGKHPSKPVDDKTNPWRDRWNDSQAWFPLYVEWEAEYVHQPFENWEFGQRPARAAATRKIAYMLKDSTGMGGSSAEKKDRRTLSGRSLILPQPTSAMRVHVERLFANMPLAELNSIVKPQERKELLKKLDEVAMLSLPLAGLTDHLTTRYQGSHVKPLVRQPGMEPVALREAIELLPPPPLGWNKPLALSMIKEESHLTPYGSLPTLVDSHVSGFKPVTHGKMRFTKINIIDKFGQVAHAIDPNAEESPPIFPSASQEYSMNDADHGTPAPPSKREYIQLPMAINQPSRLNAQFLVRDTEPGRISDSDNDNDNDNDNDSCWRPSTEFEKPIWGWVVINYVNNGLQFFLPDGTFYREVRSTAGTINWLPFGEPPTPSNNPQLDALINSLVSKKERLQAFKNMIMLALKNSVPTPNAYSQFMNSLVGRPLVLANMGWSLELSADSLKNESTLEEQKPENAPLDLGLLRGDGNSKKQYEFSLKLGDKERNHDGLIGYFLGKPSSSSKGRRNGDGDDTLGDLDVSKIYTHFADTGTPSDASFLTPIDSSPYPKLQAFWLDPKGYPPIRKGEEIDVLSNARRYEAERNQKLGEHLFGALFDPFAPITGYSAILPPRTLQLPSWVWETALKRITTFFHAGPLLVTEPIPQFNEDYRLKQSTYKADVKKSVEGAQLRIPALRAADWAWLQPYYEYVKDDAEKEPTGAGPEEGGGEEPHEPLKEKKQVYMSIEIGGVAGGNEAPGWRKGPLTAVEGFMQLKEPVEQGNDQKEPSN
ncbi:hypothetical protein B0T20DRAFT_462088 [Sordaria brevicollis]|uniref:Uncharacterized protein n=1 Tax=Sordaria brevicollis TaxID=83679 RepID=A0AAE0PBG4_SORBR|nr:hypothetical protein B0T20DRAFT_462088 [Sordaria brevicollis]